MIAASATALLIVLLGYRWQPRPERVAELTAVEAMPASRQRRLGPLPLARRAGRLGPDDVAEWCARLAAACRSGDTLGAALRTTEPPEAARAHLRPLALALQRGVPLEDALQAIPPQVHLDVARTVIAACVRTGASPAEPLDRAAAALRARTAEIADRATHSAQARLSAVVMTVLPVAMLALLLATSPSVRAAVATPVGGITVLAGAALNVGGWRWMRRIIGAAGR